MYLYDDACREKNKIQNVTPPYGADIQQRIKSYDFKLNSTPPLPRPPP